MRHDFSPLFAQKDRRPIPAWAKDGGFCLTKPLTITGFFDCSISRHFIAPLEALQNDAVREVSIRAPVRSAKTLTGEAFLAWSIQNDPGETIWYCEKDPLADQEWSRLERMLLASPKVASLLPKTTPQGSRRDKSTGAVRLRNGVTLFFNGLSQSNMQFKGCRYLVNDECWEWEQGKLDEAYGRIGDYLKMGISKVLNISQGGEDGSDWDRIYKQGDCQEWEVECQGCHQHFAPFWTLRGPDGSKRGMRWDEHKDENGFWVIEKCLDSARYECPACGHIHQDSRQLKEEWNRTGRYKATNPNARPEKKSFHWTAIIDFPWRELLDLFLQAANALKLGEFRAMVKFFQKRMAENRSQRNIYEVQFAATQLDFQPKDKWADELTRILTVDVQEDVMWGLIAAWSKKGVARRLWFGKLFGFADIEKLRTDWGIMPRMVALDTGHKAKGERGVYAAIARYGWTGLKGTDDKVFSHEIDGKMVQHSYSEIVYKDPEIGVGPAAGRRAPLIHFASDTMADRFDGLVATGRWIEPKKDDDAKMREEWHRQVSAEVRKEFRDPKTNRSYFARVLLHRDNHGYDDAKMQTCIATTLGLIADPV